MSIVSKFSAKLRALIAHELSLAFMYDPALKRSVRRSVVFEVLAARMQELNKHCSDAGITSDRYGKDGKEVIVSLTTYGMRLQYAYIAIESVMQGSILPNRIILWLEEGLKGKPLPSTLLRQQKRGLEIRYCEDIKSYKKLIPTLKQYPDACIVTIDDDTICDFLMLERLVMAWKEDDGKHTYSSIVDRLSFDKEGRLLPYWEGKIHSDICDASSKNIAIGVAGVLYPAGCFDPEVFNQSVFMSIAPTADDIWFWAMTLKNGYTCRKLATGRSIMNDFLSNEDAQGVSLNIINNARGQNNVQLKAVVEKYGLTQFLNT